MMKLFVSVGGFLIIFEIDWVGDRIVFGLLVWKKKKNGSLNKEVGIKGLFCKDFEYLCIWVFVFL